MSHRTLALAFVVASVISSPLLAQAAPGLPRGATAVSAPLAVSLLKDVTGAGDKFIALAKAIPADKYDWKPADGTRTVREVLLHVASDNYLLPLLAGPVATAAPAATGIDIKDFQSVSRYEKRPLTRDAVIAELERSFVHLYSAMGKTTAPDMAKDVNLFGQKMVLQDMWILTTTHLHEHLGQGIAYARSVGIKPPWSN